MSKGFQWTPGDTPKLREESYRPPGGDVTIVGQRLRDALSPFWEPTQALPHPRYLCKTNRPSSGLQCVRSYSVSFTRRRTTLCRNAVLLLWHHHKHLSFLNPLNQGHLQVTFRTPPHSTPRPYHRAQPEETVQGNSRCLLKKHGAEMA